MAEPASGVIEAWVRSILRCPVCGSPLDDAASPGGDAELWCDATRDELCGRQYRIDEGIPVLLADEARHPGSDPAGAPDAAAGGSVAGTMQ